MKYVMCPHCGRRLCRGEPGTQVEVECAKCGKVASIFINGDNLMIKEKPLAVEETVSMPIRKNA